MNDRPPVTSPDFDGLLPAAPFSRRGPGLGLYRPTYRKAEAEDGWKRMLAWFKKHGVA